MKETSVLALMDHPFQQEKTDIAIIIIIHNKCLETVIHGSCISAHFISEELIASHSGLSFQGCLCSKQHWELEIVSPPSLIKLLSLLEKGQA